MWRFGHRKSPSQELSRSNTSHYIISPPHFSAWDTKGNMWAQVATHHEERGKYWMFVLSSLYCRWQPPLFWGLSKHTFTTNNHGRVGMPAFQPYSPRSAINILQRQGWQTIRRVSQHETATSFAVFPFKVPLDGKQPCVNGRAAHMDIWAAGSGPPVCCCSLTATSWWCWSRSGHPTPPVVAVSRRLVWSDLLWKIWMLFI